MPPGVITVTCTVPVPGGLVAVISVPESTVITALTPPKSTAVALLNPLPVMVTLVPPALVPLVGEIVVTLGDAELDDGGSDGVAGPAIPRLGDDGLGDAVAGPAIA